MKVVHAVKNENIMAAEILETINKFAEEKYKDTGRKYIFPELFAELAAKIRSDIVNSGLEHLIEL